MTNTPRHRSGDEKEYEVGHSPPYNCLAIRLGPSDHLSAL